MSALDYIKIDGASIWRPPQFMPTREDLYRGDYTTCTGKQIKDRIGWKYADMTLTWDGLPQNMVDVLVGMTGACTLEFDDADGELHEEQVVRDSLVALRHKYVQGGVTIWKSVSVKIVFIGSHTED